MILWLLGSEQKLISNASYRIKLLTKIQSHIDYVSIKKLF